MKLFYVGINRFMYKHPFIKSYVHFTSLFCPWMVDALFLLKIVIESQSGFYLLFIKPFSVLIKPLIFSTVLPFGSVTFKSNSGLASLVVYAKSLFSITK